MTNETISDADALIVLCERGVALAEQLLGNARHAVASVVSRDGRVDPNKMDAHQLAAHGFAWQATYVEAMRRTLIWVRDLRDANTLTTVEASILRLGFAEYLAQLTGGIPVSQTEMIRPGDLGVSADAVCTIMRDPVLAELS